MRKASLAVAAVALVAGLAHVRSLPGAYTFDDHAIVEGNPRLAAKDLSGVRERIGSNYWGPGAERTGERLWRPVPVVTYALERALVGRPAPRVAHAVNVLLHALAAVLALALFGTLVSRRAALLGALVFAAHPLHAEAVAGIVGRAEVLALALGLGGLLLHVRGRGALARVGEALALFLALGSKESAVAAIPIAVVLDVVIEGGLKGLRPGRYVAPLGALVVYVGARAAAIGSLVAESGGRTLGDKTLLERLPYTLAVYRDAWRDVLWPVHGTSAHFPLPDTSVPGLALAALVQVAVLGAAGFLLVRALRGRRLSPVARGVAVGLAGFELALLPVSNLIPIGVVYAERLLYAPTLWASLLVAALAGRFTRSPAAVLAAALLVGGLVQGSSRNDGVWADDVTLFRASVQRFPDEPQAHLLLAGARLQSCTGSDLERDRERALDAVTDAKFAADHFPDTQPLKAKANVILAQALVAVAPGSEKVRAEAQRVLGKALALNPRNVDAWLARARLRFEGEDAPDWARVVADAGQACALDPDSYVAHWTLGFALWKSGNLESAARVLDEAAALDPSPGEAFFYRAQVLWGQGERGRATPLYVRAVECLLARGRRSEARAAVTTRLPELPPAERQKIQALLEGAD